MPRRARLTVAGIPLHIIHRGNNRSQCFFTWSDYSRYVATLGEQAAKFDCRLHAYVLMTNHVHLLITPTHDDSAALLMKNLAQRHTQFINHRDGRSGTLWDGRFKSCIAQDDAYVLTCYRYIEMNPVRAGMVAHPRDYYWSSYGVNGGGNSSSLITPHPDYLALGETAEDRIARYRSLFSSGLEEHELRSIRLATNGNYILGNEPFLSRMEAHLSRPVTRTRKPGDRPLTDQNTTS